MGDCQNYGPFLGPHYSTGPNMGPNLGDPKRDHNFVNSPGECATIASCQDERPVVISKQRGDSIRLPTRHVLNPQHGDHQTEGEAYITHNGDHSSRDVRRRATQAHGLQPQTCFGGVRRAQEVEV